MKTCFICKKVYEYVSPLFAIVKLKNEEKKISNFCNIECCHNFILKSPEFDEAKIAYFPLGKLSMCQFCGSFTHPMEYCTIYGTSKEAQKAFQKIGNCLGEHSNADGYVCIGHIGEAYNVEADLVSYTGEMVKTLPDKMLRNELLYFWDDDDYVRFHADSIQDTSVDPVTHSKEFITKLNITPGVNSAKTIFMIQLATKIYNPHKLFFPFDINDKNCWFPIYKQKESRRLLITCENTINNSEYITTEEEPPEIYEEVKDVKMFD